MSAKWLTITFLLFFVLAACTERGKDGKFLDTTTSGSITITADEALRPLLDAEVSAFENLYQNAKVKVIYSSEQDAIDAMLNDSVRLVITTRSLNKEEEKILNDQKLKGHTVTIAKSGVALMINKNNKDSLLSVDRLKDIFSGKVNTWEGSGKKQTPIQVVFDQPNSGIVRYLADSLHVQMPLPSNCFAVNSNSAVVEHIAKQPDALGLIDVSWISDRDDSTANGFLQSVRIVGVSNGKDFVKPYQAYIADRQYPLLRNIIAVSREARAGLASGFIAFMAGEKGQRIVLKSGLVPATMPIRLVSINRDPIQ